MKDLAKSNRAIAKNIILAQCASDGGKHIGLIANLIGEESAAANNSGYSKKDSYVLEAIERINRSRSMDFRYAVTKDSRLIGNPYLVYFSFKLDGKRHQVSFHCFSGKLEKFLSKSQGTRWDRKSSREACVKLAHAFDLAVEE